MQKNNEQLASNNVTCVDLFCGIGGFHQAAKNAGIKVVFASEIDDNAKKAYRENYGLEPYGDIKTINASEIPDHDILCAGFPCQPFSIIGSRKGFDDERGVLFFEIERILKAKLPRGVILENVKRLVSADKGEILRSIIKCLENLGYKVEYRILNALNFGLPQKRERTIIVAMQKHVDFPWPNNIKPMKPLSDILELNPDKKYYVSDKIRNKRLNQHTSTIFPSIWHENKSGNISSHEWACALRAGASYNYLLVNGERRLTSRELLRLQGFPDDWKIVCSDMATRKQAGNAVPVPMVEDIMKRMLSVYE